MYFWLKPAPNELVLTLNNKWKYLIPFAHVLHIWGNAAQGDAYDELKWRLGCERVRLWNAAKTQYHRIDSSTLLFIISHPSVVITWIKGFQHTLYLCWISPLLIISTIWPPVPPLLDASQSWSRPPRRPMWTSPRWPTRWWRGPATPAGWWFSKPWSPRTTSWCLATRWGYCLHTHTLSTYLCWLLVLMSHKIAVRGSE